MKLTGDVFQTLNGVEYRLDHILFRLDSNYNDVYTMNYITNDLLNKDIITFTIKEKFSEHNMATYFGDRANLSCDQVRQGYLQLIDYFKALFIEKMKQTTNLDIEKLPDSDPYVCLIAECVSIIRASIKKYMRHRTSANQYKCSKNILDKRNANKYGCSTTYGTYNYCPTFNYLRKEKRKTCKQIISSSAKTSDFMTFLSKRCDKPPINGPMMNLQSENTPIVLSKKNPHTNKGRFTRKRETTHTINNSPFYNYSKGYDINQTKKSKRSYKLLCGNTTCVNDNAHLRNVTNI